MERGRRDNSLIVLSLSLVAVFFTANYHILLTADVSSASPFLLLMNLLLLRPLYLYLREKGRVCRWKTDRTFMVLWIVFGFMVFLSELYNGDVIEGFFFLYLVPVIYFIALQKIYSINGMHLIHIISALPFVMVAGLFVVTRHVFTTNSIALIVLFAGISAICLEKEVIKRLRFFHFLLYQVVLGILFIIMAGINSRTSMLSFIVAYAINAVFNIIWINKNNIEDKSRYNIFYILILIVGLAGVYLILGRLDRVLYKWGSDFSSNRFTIWGITIDKADILGLGYRFYTGTPDPDPAKIGYSLKGPHNIFFGILGYTGILSLIIFSIIIVKYIADIILNFDLKKVMYNNRDTVVFGTAFIFSGLLEGLLQFPFYRPANLMWLFILGSFYFTREKASTSVTLTEKKQKIESEPESLTETKEKEKENEVYIEKIPAEYKKRAYFNSQVFWLIMILLVALLSVILVPGDGNILGILKVLGRYIK